MPASSSSRSFSSEMVWSCSITSRHCLRRRLRSQKMAACVSVGKIAVVGDFLRLAVDLQDLHVGMGEALGLVQERLGDVGIGDVAALLHGLLELGIFGEPVADEGEADLEQVGEVFVGGAQQAELVGDGAEIRLVVRGGPRLAMVSILRW